MPTQMEDLLRQARSHLTAPTDTETWTDEELLDLANNAIKDLWRRLNDLFQDYFLTLDETNVYLNVDQDRLDGVPDDVFRIVAIEPRVLGSDNPNAGLIFRNKPYNSPEFTSARARPAIEPRGDILYYTLISAGAPVGPPAILIAPQVTSQVALRLVYNQVLERVDEDDDNPIPGESDNAIIAWIVAYARVKDRDDRAPDPDWLALYATEKSNLIQQLTPRSTQEPQVVEGMFEDTDLYGFM